MTHRMGQQVLLHGALTVGFVALLVFTGKMLSSSFYQTAHNVAQIITSEEAVADTAIDFETIDPDTFHITAVNHKQQLDAGLRLYRNPASQQDVVWFYSHITGDAAVSELILEYANRNDIPPSLAFALAWEESRYQIKAVNNNGTSIDRGLFQLNDKSFPYLTVADFFDPEINIRHAMQHLSFCLQTAGNEIAALAMYNAGANKVRNNNTPQKTLNYVSRIMNYRSGLEELFSTEIEANHLDDTNQVRVAQR